MRVVGWCVECRRIKYVRVSGQQIALSAARRSNVMHGICSTCEDKKHGHTQRR